MQGRIVDQLAHHAVPSDPAFVNILLWMTDTEPAIRPSAATARDMFMWLQEDLRMHGRACLGRLETHWDMPRHPKLQLFPAKAELTVEPQHGKAEACVPVLGSARPSIHDAAVPASPASALLRSWSWEWPDVHSAQDACCPAGIPSVSAESLPKALGCGRTRTRSHAFPCMNDLASPLPHKSPFNDPPAFRFSRPDPCCTNSSTLVPTSDGTSFAQSPSHPHRPLALASASVQSGPLTSLHQAFPSCCGPPSVQASIISRAADALPDVDELAPHSPVAAKPDAAAAASPRALLSPEHPDAAEAQCAMSTDAGRWRRREFDVPTDPLLQLDLSDELAAPAAGGLLQCCEMTTCVGSLLGTLCDHEFTAWKHRPSQTGMAR